MRLAMQVHRARRFYERPESKRQYHERPVPEPPPQRCRDRSPTSTSAARLSATTQRCSVSSGSSSTWSRTIRRACEDSHWLSARIVPQGDDSACRTTRTRCETAGDDLVTVAADRRLGGRAAAAGRRRSLCLAGHGPRRLGAQARPLPLDDPAAAGDRAERRPDPRCAHSPPLARLHGRPPQEGAGDPGSHRTPELTARPPSTAATRRCSTRRTSPTAFASRSGTTPPRRGSRCTHGASTRGASARVRSSTTCPKRASSRAPRPPRRRTSRTARCMSTSRSSAGRAGA